MRRYQFTASQWQRIAPFLPHPTHHHSRGRPWQDHQRIVHGILWILHTGAPWRDLPERYGPWQTVYGRFNRWRKDGTWNRIFSRLLYRLDRQGGIQHDLWCVDSTIIRATRAAGGARRRRRPRLGGNATTQLREPEDHALGVSRGGFGTKIHLVMDSGGHVLGIWVSPGQRHDSRGFEPTMQRVHLPRRRGRNRWPIALAGDRGYSYPAIRRWLRRRRVETVISRRSNERRPESETFDTITYRRRNLVERVVGWFKECRRLVTRFEKLAVNFVAFWIVANIEKIAKSYL